MIIIVAITKMNDAREDYKCRKFPGWPPLTTNIGLIY